MSELREKLEEAYAGSGESSDSDETSGMSDDSFHDETVSADAGDSGDAQDAGTTEDETTGTESADDAGTEGVARKPDEGDASAGAAGSEGDEKAAGSQEEDLAAPQGWKPLMREKYWKELPKEVKAEITRREVDIANGMAMANEARQQKQDFDKIVGPYAAEIQSRGASPLGAFDNYLKTAYNLRYADAAGKATIVADIMKQYGVDVGALDTVLTTQINAGKSVNGADTSGVENAINKAMAPVTQFMQNFHTQQAGFAESQHAQVKTETDKFLADPANEFVKDVADDMANLLEAASARQQNMTLQEAYDRAILLHSDIAEIVSNRKLQSEATKRDEAAKKAKAKSLGVQSSSPDSVRPVNSGSSVRSALEAAFSNSDTKD